MAGRQYRTAPTVRPNAGNTKPRSIGQGRNVLRTKSANANMRLVIGAADVSQGLVMRESWQSSCTAVHVRNTAWALSRHSWTMSLLLLSQDDRAEFPTATQITRIVNGSNMKHMQHCTQIGSWNKKALCARTSATGQLWCVEKVILVRCGRHQQASQPIMATDSPTWLQQRLSMLAGTYCP